MDLLKLVKAEDQNRIIAGTGHRPKWMPCKYDESHEWAHTIKTELREGLKDLKPKAVISGMAIGWDMWLAEAAISVGVPLWAYIPFRGQGKNWPTVSQNRYNRILKNAEKVIHTSEEYSKNCFFIRDEKMIDDCTLVFALHNEEIKRGGTFYTVNYANKLKRTVINYWRGEILDNC